MALCLVPNSQGIGITSNRIRSVHGSLGHHSNHRHRHQPCQEPWNCSDLRPKKGMGGPMDLLGWTLQRCSHCSLVQQIHLESRSRESPGVIQEQSPYLIS